MFSANIAIGFENVDLFQRLNAYAFSDLLCNLPNRTRLLQLIEERQELGLAGWGIALVDIDRFSEINDALGYENGDRLLRAVAERLQGRIEPPMCAGAHCRRYVCDFRPKRTDRSATVAAPVRFAIRRQQYFLRVRGTIGLVRLDDQDGRRRRQCSVRTSR